MDYQTDTAQGSPNPSWKAPGGCGCTGGRKHRKTRKHRGGVGAVDDALFAVGTSYAAKKWGQKKPLGGRKSRKHHGGAGVVDDALVAGTALGLAHYFTKKGKKGGKRKYWGGAGATSVGPYVPTDSPLLSGGYRSRRLPRRFTRRSLI